MTTTPGADERRVQHELHRRGVAFAPQPPAAPTKAATLTAPGNDSWWHDLYTQGAADTHPDTVRTAPDRARIGGGRLPDWRKGETADLRGHDPDPPDKIQRGGDSTPVPDTATPPTDPPPPPKGASKAADEPGWDWRRLLHWPGARFTCGACAALLPFFSGQSTATEWGSVLTQCRTEAGVLPAWIIAGVGATVAVTLVRRRRAWYSYALLTSAFIGTIAMASPFDIVTFVTGVTQ